MGCTNVAEQLTNLAKYHSFLAGRVPILEHTYMAGKFTILAGNLTGMDLTKCANLATQLANLASCSILAVASTNLDRRYCLPYLAGCSRSTFLAAHLVWR